ncbi:MAG: nucleotidyltransferase [Pyrodictiaceae archaeon]
MTYTIDDLAWLFSRLYNSKINGIVIGSTIIELELGQRRFEDDVDIFALSPNPLIEEEAYMEIASRESWQYSYTALGTPKFVVRAPSGGEIIVEFYENIHDFYIPEEIIQRAMSKRIRGVTIRLLQLEDYIVLKAKAAREKDVEDLRIIKEYIDRGKLKLDQRMLKQALEHIPKEDRNVAVNKLRQIGFKV